MLLIWLPSCAARQPPELTNFPFVQPSRLAKIDHLGATAKAAGSQAKIDQPNEKPGPSHNFGERVEVPPNQRTERKTEERIGAVG